VVRGTPGKIRARIANARRTMTVGAARALGVLLLLFAAMGAFIGWNTVVRNPFESHATLEKEKAALERTYKSCNRCLNRASKNDVAVDFLSGGRALRASRDVRHRERHVLGHPAHRRHAASRRTRHDAFVRPRRTRSIYDRATRFGRLRPPGAASPGEKIALTFALSYETPGFSETLRPCPSWEAAHTSNPIGSRCSDTIRTAKS